ncbi:MAG: hypothetical protein AB1630_02725 [bacterium]
MKKIILIMAMTTLCYADNPLIIGTKSVSPLDKQIGEAATFTYTIEYENTGAGTATNVIIYDQIPEGMEYIGGSAGTETLPATITYSNKHPYDWKTTETNPVIYIMWEIIGNIEQNKAGKVRFAVERRE